MGEDRQQKEIGPKRIHRVGVNPEGNPVVVAQTIGRQEENQLPAETLGKPDIFDRAKKQYRLRDPRTIVGELEIALDEVRKGIKDGRVLSPEEVGGLLNLVREVPDGKRWELGLMVGKMIVDASGKTKDAEKIWQELTDKTKPTQREESRKENPGMAMVYDYIVYYGGDPNTIKWQNVLDLGDAVEAIEANRNIPDAVLDRLVERAPLRVGESVANYQKRIKNGKDKIKTREKINLGDKGGWESKEKKLQSFENMLGMEKEVQNVNVRDFWENQLLQVFEDRLGAMRSPTKAELTSDGKKMVIVQRGLDKLLKRGRLASRLSFEILDPGSELGDFLNQHNRLDFWRGKAAIDRMWSLYTGIPIESGKTRAARPIEGTGLFTSLNKERLASAEVVECCGPAAELQIAQDDKVCDALNILYHLAAGKTYQQSLQELKDLFKRKYNQEIDLNKELPREIADAVRIAFFYGLDIRANGNKDARYKSWLVGEFENLDWCTTVEGQRINLLGSAFALKPDDMVGRGFFSGRNASLLFNATTGSHEVYSHKNREHRKEMWQSGFFFMLGLDRGLNELVRHYDVNPALDEENVLPGTKGKFERFNNKDERHRRAIFLRWVAVAAEDVREQKASWDDNLRQRINKVMTFFSNAGNNGYGTNRQIWFDPADGRLAAIWDDLNLLLEDPRPWGMVGDFRDTELQQRNQAPTRYNMENALMQDCAAAEAAEKITQLLKKPPNTLPEEMDFFPAQIMEMAMSMRHNFNSELNFRNLITLFQASATLAIDRFLQVQIPNREMIEKMMHEYKLFDWRRIFDGIKGLPLNGKIERSTGTEFFLRQIEEELDITETGLVGRFDNSIELLVNLLDTTEAFGWDMERSMFLEKRAFVYQYLSSWLNHWRPVEGYKTPVVIQMADGSTKVRNLCVQDLTYREVFGWKAGDTDYRRYLEDKKEKIEDKIEREKFKTTPPLGDKEEFFTPMTKQEIGDNLGGSLLAEIIAPEAGFTAGDKVYILGRQDTRVKVYCEYPDGKIVRELIEVNNLQEIDHEINGWQRPGEVMLEGMRAVLEDGNWVIKVGTWEFEREARAKFRFVESKKGYSRAWEDMVVGNDNRHKAWTEKVKIEKKDGELVKEVHLPCLKMTEEQEQKFFLHRYMNILFQLLTGRAEGGATPGQAVIDLDEYYENPKAFISGLIRQIKWLELTVERVQGKQALRGMAMKGEHLSYEFVLMSENARERYAVSKAKEFEGNISFGMQQQLVKASDAIIDEEIQLLNKNFWHKTGLWLNKTARWKFLSLPMTGISIGGVALLNIATKALTGVVNGSFQAGSSLTYLLTGALEKVGVGMLAANAIVYVGGFAALYLLTFTGWDRYLIQGIIKAINNHKAPDFGKFFNKYLDQNKNKVDAFFPVE